MKSGIFSIWKYTRVLWLALTILVFASAVHAQQNLTHPFTLKNGLISISILIENFDKEQEITVEGTNFGINTADISQIFHFDFLNSYNPSKDRLHYYPQTFEQNHIILSRIIPAIYSQITLENFMLIAESSDLSSGITATQPQGEFRIRHPWWGIWYADIFLLLILSAAGIFIVKKTISLARHKEREKAEIARKTAELEILALQAQMNPHFIFNSINSIQYFVLTNRTDDVLSYLSDFSKVVRASLANITKRMVPLHEEIDSLKSYLRIERMRFPDKFEFKLEIKATLDPLVKKIPPYLIQPFVENSVKHGFIDKNGKGHLIIALEEIDSETLKCTVIDDGIGRAKSRETDGSANKPARPQSSVITETRLRLLNSFEKPDRYKVVYTDLTDNEGNSAGLKVEVYLAVENA